MTVVVYGGFILLLIAWGALLLHNKRRLEEIRGLEADSQGLIRRVNFAVAWPRYCRDCGATLHTWRAVRAHLEHSPCAAIHQQLEQPHRADEEPPVMWSATVTGTRPAYQPAAIDTMLDPKQARGRLGSEEDEG